MQTGMQTSWARISFRTPLTDCKPVFFTRTAMSKIDVVHLLESDMATLVHPGGLIRRYFVDANGKKVPKGTPGAREVEWTNKKYYIRYRDSSGKPKQVPAFKDKRASEKKLADLQVALER